MAAHLFEYSYIGWSSFTALTSAADWDRWEEMRQFRPLPPTQQQRHRRRDDVIYMGDGHTNIPYSKQDHALLEFRPAWGL